MVVEMVLVFSDQQLLTGLAILIASYIQALGGNLSVYHWNTVIYLAWLSSTVHLMSLSVLRNRLRTNKVLRFIRLCVMGSILGLLLATLVPTVTNGWPNEISRCSSFLGPGLPVRCLWDIRLNGVNEQGDYWISYVSLLGAFAWNFVNSLTAVGKEYAIGAEPDWSVALRRQQSTYCRNDQAGIRGLHTRLSSAIILL